MQIRKNSRRSGTSRRIDLALYCTKQQTALEKKLKELDSDDSDSEEVQNELKKWREQHSEAKKKVSLLTDKFTPQLIESSEE